MITNDLLVNIAWENPPLSWLSPAQQVQLQDQAKPRTHSMGEVIWSTDMPEHANRQFLVLSGNVRLVPTDGKPVRLQPGDWFGDLLELSDQWKARTASKEVVVLEWHTAVWQEFTTAEIKQFWAALRLRYQPDFSDAPLPVTGYPFVSGLNTAAACLTMLAQHLGSPVQQDWMQRQVRGQQPKNLINAGEKAGMQMRRLLMVDWQDLKRSTFPALLQWQQPDHWVVAYGVRGDRLLIGDPMNPAQRCESMPRQLVQSAWDGHLWQVELIQKSEKFNLSWFLPAVWKFRFLLGEVLLASFTLQLLGLTSPIITQVIIDKVMVQGSLSTLDVMAFALIAAAIFEAFLGILRMFIFTHTTNRLDLALSAQLFRHLLRLPLSYFEARRVGDTVARVQELEEIRQFLTSTALTVVLDSIFSVVYLGMMFFYSPKLTGVAMAVIPLFAILTLCATPVLRYWLNETFNRSADSQSFLVETITGIHSIKAHAAEKASRDRWEGLYARFVRTGFKASTTGNISNHIGDFLTSFSALADSLVWGAAGD